MNMPITWAPIANARVLDSYCEFCGGLGVEWMRGWCTYRGRDYSIGKAFCRACAKRVKDDMDQDTEKRKRQS